MSQNWYSIEKKEGKKKIELVLDNNKGVCLDASFSPNDGYIIFIRGKDLYIKKLFNEEPINISEEKEEEGVTNGQASYLAQEEMDRQR